MMHENNKFFSQFLKVTGIRSNFMLLETLKRNMVHQNVWHIQALNVTDTLNSS